MARLSVRYFLRAVGLKVLNSVYYGRNGDSLTKEPRKNVFTKSAWVAFQRSLVHLLPSIASIVVIALNLNGFFIGFELAGIPGHDQVDMAALQVAAKLQELLIIASIGSIVYHRLRHDLLNRSIPFGLLGSGLSFTQISHLWSPEFLASLTCKGNQTLIAVIILSTIIASTAGPATAVLIIPRMIQFPAGETEYYINGTADDLWPSRISLRSYLPGHLDAFDERASCASSWAFTNAVCPSGGYLALMEYFSSATSENRAGILKAPFNNTRLFSQSVRGGILVHSPRGQVAPQTLAGQVRGEDITETFSYATHGATANLAMRLNYDWYRAAQEAEFMYPESLQSSRFRFYAVQQATVLSQVPAVRVLCGEFENLRAGSKTVRFPRLPNFGFAIQPNGTVLNSYEIDVADLINSNPSNAARIGWFDLQATLPANNSEAITYGLIFQSPWQSNKSRMVSGCTIDARWAKASVWSRFPGPFQATFYETREATKGFRQTSFLPSNTSSWRGMLFDPKWLDSVNFKVPKSAPGYTSGGATTIEALITSAGIASNTSDRIDPGNISDPPRYLEYIIANVLSDAASRVGSHRSFNTSGPTDRWPMLYYNASAPVGDIMAWSRATKPADYDLDPSEYTKLKMRVTVTGYGYQSSNSSDYLSLIVLFTHLVLAVVHTIYIISIRSSSGCWDTFSELVALAQQSSPTQSELTNTCAGIHRFGTFKHKVRIKVSEIDDKHIEFVFGEQDHDFEKAEVVQLGIKYGG